MPASAISAAAAALAASFSATPLAATLASAAVAAGPAPGAAPSGSAAHAASRACCAGTTLHQYLYVALSNPFDATLHVCGLEAEVEAGVGLAGAKDALRSLRNRLVVGKKRLALVYPWVGNAMEAASRAPWPRR